MAGSFDGFPQTSWSGFRNMILTKPLTYTDPNGKAWTAPVGSEINGATIPKALWSSIGSPYVGKYRRASVIHDYFVGEGSNPNVSREERREADKMFYHACRTDGCSHRFAAVLYVGVSIGTWASGLGNLFSLFADPLDESLRESPSDARLRKTFEQLIARLEDRLDNMTIEELQATVEEEL